MYDSNYITFWKGQNDEDSKKTSGCQGLREVINRYNTKDFWESENTLYNYSSGYTLSCICPNSQKVQTPRVKATISNDNEWLRCVKVGSLGSFRTITTMQFIRCSKGVTVAGDIDNQGVEGGGYARAAAGGTQGISETFLSNLL